MKRRRLIVIFSIYLFFVICVITNVYSDGKESALFTINTRISSNGNGLNWKWFIYPGTYENILLFDDRFIGVQDKSGKYGIINNNKQLIVDYQYCNIMGVGEGVARVLDFEKKYHFINYQGKVISNMPFSDALDFNGGFAAVKNNGKWGFINTSGDLVINYQYDNVMDGFSSGIVAVEKNESWYYINTSGESVFQDHFDSAKRFSEGLAGVKKNGKWGFIDKNGNTIIDYKYDNVGSFSEGKVAVNTSIEGISQWAYIDRSGKVVIDFSLYETSEGRMELLGEFSDGYALVTKSLYCLINVKGETVLGNNSYFLSGGSIYNIKHGLIPAYDYIDDSMLTRKYGLININGKPIIPFIFDYITNIHGDLVLVMCDKDNKSKTGIISLE